MVLDELAMLVMSLEPGHAEEISRAENLLSALPAGVPLSERALEKHAQTLALAALLKTQAGDDFTATTRKLGRQLAALQEMMEPAEEARVLVPTVAPAAPVLPEPVAATVETEMTGDNVADADPEILSEFINETLEHLENSEACLLKLESAPGDQESLNSVFRAFHSTKGTSSFLGLGRIKDLAHHGEMLLDRARKGELQLTGVYADLALESADTLKWMIQQLQDPATGSVKPLPPNYRDLMERLDLPAPGGAPITAPEASTPAVPAVSAPARAAEPKKPEPIIPVIPEIKVSGAASEMTERATAETGSGSASALPGASSTTVRVSTDKLDGLINMVGELVITHAMIAAQEGARAGGNRVLGRNIVQLEKITRELQDLSMSLRMVPLKATFQKMERLVRDVAKKSRKQVTFKMEGEDTEIDRNMVETINDPLVHMLRNAVDHGIEKPEIRLAAGKPETGNILLRAYHTAGNIIIELHDDGKGLDRERIFKKALEKGLVESDRTLSDAEIFKLIFLPGFSTAEKVTEVSGRGVGLDVVKKNVESIRGGIDIQSAAGQGTVFSMRIPLTLAIIDGMLLQVGSQHYLLPTLNVRQAFRPAPAALFTVTGQGEMVKLRERLIPIFRLHKLFNVQGAVENPTQGLLLVVEHEGETCALLADSLLGQQQLVIKSLPATLGKTSGTSGAAILGDGRISLILDVGSIMRIAQGRELAEAAQA
ncbi:MAG: chemotaxis protein CheA [Candidatus Firestonebacteria bacterium]|nr:chemotaxis protein CheA [Candidatus Firestonebacteria bacterium]